MRLLAIGGGGGLRRALGGGGLAGGRPEAAFHARHPRPSHLPPRAGGACRPAGEPGAAPGRGGPMLAPGPPDRPFQFIDVRDLAGWILDLVEQDRGGVFNATNDGVPLGELLAGADVVWVHDPKLVEHKIGEEDLPLWSAEE